MRLQRGIKNFQPPQPEPDADEIIDTDWDTEPQEKIYLCALIDAFGPIGRNEETLMKLLNCGVDESWFLDKNRRYIFSGIFAAALQINSPGVTVRIDAIVKEAEKASGEEGWARKEIQKLNEHVAYIKPQEIIEQDVPLWWHKLKKPKTISALGRLNALLTLFPPTLERLNKVENLIETALDGWRAEPLANPLEEQLHEKVRIECLKPEPEEQTIATDLTIFDELVNGGIGGKQSPDTGRLIVVCARPGMGKSLIATNVAARIALRGHRALMWSFEMGREELAMRDMAMRDFFHCRANGIEDPITYNKLKRHSLTEPQRKRLTPGIYSELDSNFAILLGSSNMTAQHVANQMRIQARRYPSTRLFIIDHLGLMNIPLSNRATAVGEATRQLKVTARELGIDIMLLSQLNRAAETREEKRPTLSDLRDSGCIEQDADIVIGIYRPAYYNKEDLSLANVLELISLKNRQGKSNYSLECCVYLDSCAIVDNGKFDDIAPAGREDL